MSSVTLTHDYYQEDGPKINGILWQMLLNNVPLRRPWDTLGAGKTLIQWIAVDDYSFVPNPWLPTYNVTLDMTDFASYPFANEIILGTPGYFSEVTSRNNIPKMADLAAKFATLEWPTNVKGFYFPVEIDPTWTNAKAVLGPVWDILPRPLYVSAYYGQGIDGEEAAKWLADLLPNDVHLMFQDGVGAFEFTLELAKERLHLLDKYLGKERVHLICEVFKVNPDWEGVDGTYFIPLDPEEYTRRVSFYQDIYEEGRLWVFDGPNYIKNSLIDSLQDRPSLSIPTQLVATLDFKDDVRLYSDAHGPEFTRLYTVYDPSGNHVLRQYTEQPGKNYAIYPKADYTEDFGFTPGYAVYDVMSIRNKRYLSDRSALLAQDIIEDPSITHSTISKSNWGDVVIAATPNHGEVVSTQTYYFDLMHPENPTEIMRTIVVDGATNVSGEIFADYSVELNVPDTVAIYSSPAPWSFMRWKLRAKKTGSIYEPELIGLYEAIITENNATFVKQVCILGINSLIGGYFNDLSDPLNPGGTGVPGRKDVVAASTFRKTLAQTAGLRDVEVMPVMAVVGSSPINPMPYQSGFPLTNYWWDPVNKIPGPDLIYANDIVTALGVPPTFFIECGPGETTGISFAPVEQRPDILTAWRQSNIEMLAWMRANWGNPTMPVWFQGATTSWWGTPPPPMEVNAEGARLIRDLQTAMSLEGIGFKMGSYVPDSNLYATFRDEMAEGMGWVHYSVEGYHAAAADMGQAIGANINRALNPPAWTTMRQPQDLAGSKKAETGLITMTWDARAGITNWWYVNRNAGTNAIISQGPLSAPEYNWTAADQIAAYGTETSYMLFEISEYVLAEDLIGPATNWNDSVTVIAELEVPTSVAGAKSTSTGNVKMTWAPRSGITNWWYVNRNAGSGAIISQGVLNAPEYNWPAAAQVAEYGFQTSYMQFEISEYVVATSLKGPAAFFNDTVGTSP